MGRGDKKTKKGKISKGSFGNSRLKKKIKERLKRVASTPKATAEGKSKAVKKKEEQ